MNQQQRKDTRTAILALAMQIHTAYEDGDGADQLYLVKEADDLAKLVLAFCEDVEQSFSVVCFAFNSNGDIPVARVGATSGPFASRAEAERACREALSTGRFYRVSIEERQP